MADLTDPRMNGGAGFNCNSGIGVILKMMDQTGGITGPPAPAAAAAIDAVAATLSIKPQQLTEAVNKASTEWTVNGRGPVHDGDNAHVLAGDVLDVLFYY